MILKNLNNSLLKIRFLIQVFADFLRTGSFFKRLDGNPRKQNSNDAA